MESNKMKLMDLRMDNYLSFSIVSGFFIGLVLSFLKYEEAELIVAWTLISTMGFYLITLLCTSFYVQFLKTDDIKRAPRHSKVLESFIEEFDRRERTANKIRAFIRNMERTMREDEREEFDERQELAKKQAEEDEDKF